MSRSCNDWRKPWRDASRDRGPSRRYATSATRQHDDVVECGSRKRRHRSGSSRSRRRHSLEPKSRVYLRERYPEHVRFQRQHNSQDEHSNSTVLNGAFRQLSPRSSPPPKTRPEFRAPQSSPRERNVRCSHSGGDTDAYSRATEDLEALFGKCIQKQRDDSLLVKLGGYGIGDAAMTSLARYLRLQVPNLKTDSTPAEICLDLELEKNDITEVGLRTILDFLDQRDVCLRRVKLFKNKLGDPGAARLARSLCTQCRAPEEIHLSHNGLTGRGLIAICMAVSRPESHFPCWVRMDQNHIASPLEVLTILDSVGEVSTCLAKDRHLCGPRRCAHVNANGRGGGRSVHLSCIEIQGENPTPLDTAAIMEEVHYWQEQISTSGHCRNGKEGLAEPHFTRPGNVYCAQDGNSDRWVARSLDFPEDLEESYSSDDGSLSPVRRVGADLGGSIGTPKPSSASNMWMGSHTPKADSSDVSYSREIDQLIEAAASSASRGMQVEQRSPKATTMSKSGPQGSPGWTPDWKKVRHEGAFNFMPANRPPSNAGSGFVSHMLPAAPLKRPAPFSAFNHKHAEVELREVGAEAEAKRLKMNLGAQPFSKAAAVATPPPPPPSTGSASRNAAHGEAAWRGFAASTGLVCKAPSPVAPCKAKSPSSASTPTSKDQDLGWSVDVKPAFAGKSAIASLPTPPRCQALQAEKGRDSVPHTATAHGGCSADVGPSEVVDLTSEETPRVSMAAAVESLNSVNAAVALAEAALAMAQATYVDGSSSRETAAVVAAREALSGVEVAIAAAAQEIPSPI